MKIILSIFIFFIFILLNEYCLSQVVIAKTSDSPLIDGRVNDKGWELASVITDFLQREPNEGKPMTEKTEIFILYDANNIYFGIKCYQPVESITAKEMQRGASLPFDDRVHIVLDTYHDGRNAYIFEINPLGAVGDALISENGRRVNSSWEGLFVGKSSITDQGWEAELAIPFKTLSFDKNITGWGLFMNRMIESKQEWGSWPVANINMPEYAVSDAGVITGIEGITQGIGLDITPYALTRLDSRRGETPKYKLNGGTDIYYQITPGLKASLSINTDFAETEADTRQINLTRFSIRLAEKRNFFLDGANLFTFGFEGFLTEAPSGKLNPFFSRRIGIDSEGLSVPINYGVKLIGRVDNWNIGMMHMNEKSDPGNLNFSVGRISYNIGQLSSVGMISTFGNAINESQNSVVGLDVNLATSRFMGNKTAAIMMHGIKSKTENMNGKDAAWGILLNYPNDLINFLLGHQEIGENFFAGMGFVPRTNIRESWGKLTIGPRLNVFGIRQYSFGGSFDYVTNFANVMQSKSFTINPVGIRFNSGDMITYTMEYVYEFLENDFNIYSDYIIPAKAYSWWENSFSLSTAGSRDLYGGVSYTTGKFYTGDKNSASLRLNWKVSVPLFIGGSISRNKVNLQEGNFTTDIFQFNANFLFSPNITLYNYLQFDSQSDTAGMQTRFRWILKPGDEVILVWNSGYSRSDERFIMSENAVRLKLKYNIRF